MSEYNLEYTGFLGTAQQGFIIGNGDFCASVYQRADELVWQLGKGDIWDRRYDYFRNPKPMDIEELCHGLEVEGWSSPPADTVTYDQGELIALNGTDNPERMRECLKNVPTGKLPYPCPKPAGELAFRLPRDFTGLEVSYSLDYRAGKLTVICLWPGQAKLILESVFAPDADVLALRFKFSCPEFKNILMQFPNGFFVPYPRWYFQLRRHADPDYETFTSIHDAPDFPTCFKAVAGDTGAPLAPPEIIGKDTIRQQFPGEATFPEGFEYTLTAFSDDCKIMPRRIGPDKSARIDIVPDNEMTGTIRVRISTSLTTDNDVPEIYSVIARKAGNAARKFWKQSDADYGNSFLTGLRRSTLHVLRSVYGRGPVPSGLMLSCTINDYTRWRGDFHSNYNFQSPFCGLSAANHCELLNSYEKGVEFMQAHGKIVAERYFHCRGTYIPLPSYPVIPLDDMFGSGQFCRMVYMTGWIWQHHYLRYTHTLDEAYLKEVCYPLVRSCALFFADFMKKGDDGIYHCYPSNCGEEKVTGNPEMFRDRKENLVHVKNTLEKALELAGPAGERSSELLAKWRDILADFPQFNPLDTKKCGKYHYDGPEFTQLEIWLDLDENQPDKPMLAPGHEFWTWYFGHAPLFYYAAMRGNLFEPKRDFANYVALLQRWHETNGTLTAMSTDRYSRMGGWSESLGILGSLGELLMSSDINGIRLFPNLPEKQNASFKSFRASGAFLVSARRKNGKVKAEVYSEKGGTCVLNYLNETIRIDSQPGKKYQFRFRNGRPE